MRFLAAIGALAIVFGIGCASLLLRRILQHRRDG